MLEVADVFQRYGPAYLARFGAAMLPSHRRAFRDILACRTPAMGGHLFRCDRCRHEVYSYHSCCNRACPKCRPNDTDWLDARRAELAPVPYFHVTFTLPGGLHDIARAHQKTVYAILMKAAADSLLKLAADPRYVGGTLGVMAVLHTWGRTLTYHPHVHCLVTGGGLSPDRSTWLAARKAFLVPVKALSKIFQALFLKRLRRQLPHLPIPRGVLRRKWVVNCQPAPAGTDKVLRYLGRYVDRVALSNSRLLSIDDGNVRFRYKDTRDSRWKVMRLDADEFIRRFLQHVPPRGFHKVRYYGLWSPANRNALRRLQLLLPPEPESLHAPPEIDANDPPARPTPCPHCGQGVLVRVGFIPPAGRSPP
jgi:hypothetical protein